MKISYNWLKQYVETDLPAETVSILLTDCGLEVEDMSFWYSVEGGLKGVVIGEVLTCRKHPDSDHLSITTVNIGNSQPVTIVCGASNVAAGQKVAVATIGTTLYQHGEPLQINKTKIRGVVSEGMICAEDELGLGNSHEGIMVLDPFAIPGTPAQAFFQIEKDVVFEIGLTANRSDAASHIGVARDLVAVLNNQGKTSETLEFQQKKLLIPDVSAFKPDHFNRQIEITIDDPDACPRYSGLTMTNITVGESPEWLKSRLMSIGLRPINNIVDITNFVLFETGQPLHVFDADEIDGDQVIVKTYPTDTPFITLDEVERKLDQSDVMISNVTGPMCIAGVFGGIKSGVTKNTRNIFLESACFNPVSIRKTARRHGLQTDASFRFERGSDIEITVYALKRAALLIREIAGGEISSHIIDSYPKPLIVHPVTFCYDHLDRLAGKQIDREVVKNILTDLGIIILSESDTSLKIITPSFKVEVIREVDVVEEILRIYGYNNIEILPEVKSSMSFIPKPDMQRIQQVFSDFLTSNGFYEILNNSLTRSSYYSNPDIFPNSQGIPVLNPVSKDLDTLRQTLLFGGLETISYNQNRKISHIKCYEFGTVYCSQNETDLNSTDEIPGYHEEKQLALFITGRVNDENWNTPERVVDLYTMKSFLEAALTRISFSTKEILLQPYSSSFISNGLAYYFKDQCLGFAGYVTKTLLTFFNCKQEVLYANIYWEKLGALLSNKEMQYTELPRFPEVRRDLALLLAREVQFTQIEKLVYQTEKRLVKKVGLFDVYEGDQIESGKKSYAISIVLQDNEKTLKEQEIDQVMKKIMQRLSRELGAQIR